MDNAMQERKLPDGRTLILYAQIFNYKLTISSPRSLAIGVLDDAYEYLNAGDAVIACEEWNGEGDPPGRWVRHLKSGRRRPGGNPALEYVHKD